MAQLKVALVTGCSEGGIGFHLCQKLADRGFMVYATSRTISSTERLAHRNVQRLTLDVTDGSQVQTVVETVIRQSGHIDLLVNNAGILAVGPTVEATVDQAKAVYDTNVFAIIRMCGAVVPHMAKRKQGTILNVGSVVGEFPTPWMGLYDSSKAAVRILTEVLSMECKPFNIRVVLAAAGSVKTKIIGKQDDFKLAPNSIYAGFFHNIRQRLEAARDGSEMPVDEFAEALVAKVIRSNPPREIMIGGSTTMFRFLALIPRFLYLNIIWSMFSKPEPKAKQD
ncbi:NAD-P-binding protein [Mycena polygramma]|nr:NAD-P-binding protein [Mycena polygramma]